MSQRLTASISLYFGSTRLESGLTSTSATCRSRVSALSAIGWVTKTRGRLTTTGSRCLGHLPDGGVDLGHHLLRQQGHRALAQRRIAPVLAGVEQRAEVADALAEFQNLVGDLVRRAVDDQLVADFVERDLLVGLVEPRLEQFDAARLSLVKSWL
jgi:hypothetical protein